MEVCFFLNASNASSFIIPKKPMNLLKGILQNIEGDVNVEFNESNVSFSFDKTILTCRLIDGKYPNYEARIPIAPLARLNLKGVLLSSNHGQIGTELILALVGVDFGSTNTAVTYSNRSSEQEKLQLRNRRRFILGRENNDNNRYALANELFFFQNDDTRTKTKSIIVSRRIDIISHLVNPIIP